MLTRIKEKMNQLNLNKADLSRITSIPYSTIDNWFKRNSSPNSDVIEKLSTALNVSLEWLITGEEPEQEKLPEEKQKLLNYFDKCSQEGKERILEQAEFISTKYPKRGELLESKIS